MGAAPRYSRVALVLACITGCIDRARVNERCEWDRNDSGALDLTTRPNQLHLYKDVELAEELAIRYADRLHQERFGSYGHGGLIDNGRMRDQCMSSLLDAIAAAHDLPRDRVVAARATGYRDPRWDAGVLVSFAGLYGWLAWIAAGVVVRRFPRDEGAAALAVPLLAAIPVALIGYQLFTLWSGVFEVIRVGNGHISTYRAAKNPWPAHAVALLVAAAGIFLLSIALRHVVPPRPKSLPRAQRGGEGVRR